MAFNLNQFKLTNNVGEVMNPAANVIQATVLSSLSASSYYIAGQVVAFGTGTNDMPTVRLVTTGCGIGVIVFNAKKDKYYANDICGIALNGTIITMLAASAIMRGDTVAHGTTAGYINTITTGNGIGKALDIAVAANDIIRVLIMAGVDATIAFYTN